MNSKPTTDLQSLAERLLLQRYSPAAVLVNRSGDILHIYGRTGHFLEPATGKANWNILAMAREGLGAPLSEVFHDAVRQQGTLSITAAQTSEPGKPRQVDITVQPLQEPDPLAGMVMVVFSDITAHALAPAPDHDERAARQSARLMKLEQALQFAHQEHQTTREEMQTSREELTSTNEELQSTNEELTTTAEELRTMNEELVRARSAAEQGLVRYTDLFDSAPVGYFTIDRSGVITQANIAGTDLLGLTREHPPGGRFALFVTEADRPVFSTCLERAFTHPGPQECEISLWHGSGSPRQVRMSAVADRYAHTCRVVLVDVSEIRQTAAALKRSEEGLRVALTASKQAEAALIEWKRRYEATIDASGMLLYDWDPVSNQVSYGGDCERLLGYRMEEMSGGLAHWLDLIHPDDRQSFNDEIRRVIATEASFRLQYRLRHGTGHWLTVQDDGHFIRNAAGEITRMVGFVSDITERAAQRLREETRGRARALLADGAPLPQILDTLVRGAETEHPGMLASVLLLDEAGTHVLTMTAPNIPDFFNRAIHGAPIGPTAGSCGTAAFTGKRVVTSDIRTDPRWVEYRSLAEQAGFAACWSEPIIGHNGRILGTFALYHGQPRTPSEREITTITACAQLAAVAIERHRQESTLQATLASLEAAQSIAHIGNWAVDLTTMAVSGSAEAFRILGLDPQRSNTVADVAERIHPEDRLPPFGHGRPIDPKALNAKQDVRVIRPDGSLRWIHRHVELVTDASGKPLRLVGTAQDITERKLAEEALFQSEERYRRIVQNANEGIWMIDAQSRTSFANPKMAELLQTTAEEMMGRPITDFIDDEWSAIAAEKIRRRKQGMVEQFDFRFRRRDGTDLWALMTASPLVDAKGNYVGAISMVTDITERKRLEDELRHAQKMEAVGRLAGGIAHDFNNQLTVIQGYGSLALTKTKDDAVARCLTHVVQASERSADLVRQLLTFSRKGRHTVTPVDLHVVINETIDVLGRSLSKLIRLKKSLEAANATVRGDPSLLQNAFLNLALNARDAMPSGGDLLFATTIIELDATRIARLGGGMEPGRYLLVTVSDNGQGMSDEVQRHLFEPFFSTKAPGQGTGLGLASVYGTIKQHGGGIEVDSAVGHGTIFRVYLPHSAPGPLPTKESADRSEPPTQGDANILVIDDEEFLAALVADTLAEHGYRVVCKHNGADGLEHYRGHWQNTDLVVLDMNMPTMGGPETFAAMRAINPKARVLIMSGYSEEGGVETLLQQGARAFLPKPFRPEDLGRVVAQLLAERS